MPIASDLILDWATQDGYSLSEAGWIRPQDRKFYFEVTAEKDGHRTGAGSRDGGCQSRIADRVSVARVVQIPLDAPLTERNMKALLLL